MSRYNIMFFINSTEYFFIESDVPLKNLDCCSRFPIYFKYIPVDIFLSNNTVQFDLQQLQEMLIKALHNELLVHTSITQDIGYLYNEYYQDDSTFVEIKLNGEDIWIGFKYRLWEGSLNKQRSMTWIYNDIGGNIIFAITPFYPFLFCDPDEEPNYLPYEEWIKSYKPYLIAKLSRETAEQWLAQANSILEQIDKNNPH